VFAGLPRPNDPPDPSQGLRPGSRLKALAKARLPQDGGPPPPVVVRASGERAVRARRDPVAPPLPPPSRALRASLVAAGVLWLAAAAAEVLLGVRLLGLAGLGVGGTALRWSVERPRHAGWWVLAASGVVAAARIAWLLATR
jgi:hypothetical protein